MVGVVSGQYARQIGDTDWSDEESVLSTIRALYLDSSYKERSEKRAIRNKHVLFGDQWNVLDAKTNKWSVDKTQPHWRARLVYNDVLVSVENRIAKLVREKRVWSPDLAGDSLEDFIGQRIQSRVMDWYYIHGLKMKPKMRLALQWAMSSDAMFFHVYWDKDAGPIIKTTLQEWVQGWEGITDPSQKQQFVQKMTERFGRTFGQDALQKGIYEGPAGDPAVDIAPIFEISWWPHTAITWDQVRIWMRSVRKPVEQVAEMTGISPDDIRDLAIPSNGSPGTGGDTQWRDLYFAGGASPWYDQSTDSVTLHTIYRTPSRDFPKGRQALALGFGYILPPGLRDINNEMGIVPIIPLVEKPIRGQPTGTNTVDQLFSAQQDINVSMSQAADYRNSRVAPTLVEIAGNPEQPRALSTAPGRVYQAMTPNHIPASIKMPDVAIDHFRFADSDRVWMSRISGIASIDTGSTDDANVRSGRAIIALREQNNLQLVPFGEAIDEALSDIGNLVLSFLQNRVHTERILRGAGRGGTAQEMIKFRGDDLSPQKNGEEGLDDRQITVRAHSIIPRTPSESMNTISSFLESGLLTASDRNEILEVLGLGDFRRVFDKTQDDALIAQGTIEKWEAGQAVPMPSMDLDHQVHIRAIIKWKKTDGYRMAVQQFPLVMGQTGPAPLSKNIDDVLQSHRTSEARNAIRPQYDLVRADVSEWMKTRAEMLQRLTEPIQGEPPEVTAQRVAFAQEIVSLVLPAPLMAMGAGQPQQGNPKSDKNRGGQPKKSGQNIASSNNPSNNIAGGARSSDMQGVKKQDQP